MPTWRSIIESEDYQRLPLEERIKTKNEFFRNTISQSDKYKPLSLDKKLKIKTDFFTPKSEEKVEPFLPEKPSLKQVGRYAIEEFQQKSPFKYLDKPVEEVAKFIEPEVPAGRTTLGLLTKDLPRQMLAETLRAYKPSTAAAFGVGMKLAKPIVKPIAKPIGRFIWKRTPEGLKRVLLKEFTIGKGQPQAYQQMAKEAQLGRLKGAREAEQVAKTLTTKPTGKALTGEEQRYIGRIFRKETIESPVLKMHPRYQELKAISDEGRAIMDKWSSELTKSGIPKEQTRKVIEQNIGQYMARMYTSKLKPERGMFGAIKNLRLRLDGLKHRKNLSEQVRNLMGEIKEPALPVAVRVQQISSSIANNKLFSKVAQNPEWVANTNVSGNLIKMPDTATVGALKGKWVIPEIGEDINAITKVGEQAQSIYLKALSAWKYGKVVLNPATQVRNVVSNTILLDLSGTNHLRQLQLFPKAIKEYLSKGKLYQEALNDGAIGGEFVGTETMQRLRDFYIGSQKNNLQRWIDIAKMPFRKAGELYQGMEQLSKMVKYIDVLEKGGTRKLAAEQAQKWLFNYQEVPKFIDFIRKSPLGAPFATFCVSSDVQILTEKGWKFFDEFKINDKTLAYNIENENIEWQPIENIYTFQYSGKMINIKHRSLDILMTPDHRNIVRHRNKKGYIRTTKLAKELNSRDSIIVAGNYQAPKEKIIDDDMVRLVGWFITEGYLINTTNAFCIGQTNPKGQKEIEELRKRLGVDKYNIQLHRYKLGGYKLHKVYYFPAQLRDKVLKLAPDKKLTMEFIKRLTLEQLNILYEVILLADGCITGSRPVIIQKNGITAESIQILGILLGKQFGWSIRKDNCIAITISKGRYRELKRNKPTNINYEGIVWCPKTQWGTWIARRNGKVFITGNTYKAIPRLAEAIVNRPMTIYKYYALANAWNETARKTQGMLPTEYARQKRALPDWLLKDIGGMPTNLLMPYKDKYNRTQWLNLEYILPVGMAPEIMEKGIVKGGIGSPVFNILMDLTKGTDFRGKPIAPPEATTQEAMQSYISYIYRQLVPSLAPGIPSVTKGGYSFEKIMDSILKRPDFAERTRDLTPVLLDTLMGIKINPLDVNETEQFKMLDKKKRIDVLHNQFYKLQHPAISEKERERQAEIIFKKIQNVIDEY